MQVTATSEADQHNTAAVSIEVDALSYCIILTCLLVLHISR